MSELGDRLGAEALREGKAGGPGGLVTVPLPDGRLPLSSINEMVEAVVSAIPLDDEGKRRMREIEAAIGPAGLPCAGLHELEGLALTRLAFGDGCLFLSLDWSEASWDLGAGIVIGGPTLAVERTPGSWALVVSGRFRFGPVALGAELVLPEVGAAEMSLQAGLVEPLRLGDLLAELHLDGSSLDELEVRTLQLQLDIAPTEKHFHFEVEVGGWHPFGEGRGPALDCLIFALDWRQGQPVEGSFAASLRLGDALSFDARASWGGAGWEISAELSAAHADDPPGLEDLVHAATDAFGLERVADFPFDLELVSAEVSLSTASGSFHAACALEVDTSAVDVGLSLTVDVRRDASGARRIRFGGQITAAGLELDLRYEDGAFMAVFADEKGHRLHLGELCASLLELMGAEGVPELPDFELAVREILFVALPGVAGATAAGGKPKRRALLLVDLDVGFRLGSLPLVGDIFGKDAELSIRLAPRYASQPLDADQIQRINGMLPAAARPLPPTPIAAGGSFVAEVHVAGMSLALPDGPDHRAMAQAAATTRTVAPRIGGPPDTHWVAVDKQFGPLRLQRLGLGIHEGEATVLFDGGVALGPVQAAAMGLGFSLDLESHEVTPQLDGLAVAMQAGAVIIRGGFLRTRSTRPGEGDCYAGLIDVTVSEIRIAALGLYQEILGGPTFFIYGFAGFSVGLRPLITIEGIALGFGYGRRLREVGFADLPGFPLVQLAMGQKDPPSTGGGTENAAVQVLETLNNLQRYLPPSQGGLLFAVGLKVALLEALFTGFAMATVSISTSRPEELEIQLFGAVEATLPPKTPTGPWVARIELDLIARISPSKGELFVGLLIGPGSYVIDPGARLTGGMALAVWMKGDHAGDFVLTLGGYAPSYKRPAHYPLVPRLGLDWKPSEALSIKGELYAAITPAVFMAGGRLHADFSSGKLHAWFDLGMDLLIRFKPFQYDFSVYISIGIRYGSIGLDLSADLHIWGPEFSGSAHISVHILFFSVSLSVSFGAGATPPPPLSWEEFEHAFLPPVTSRAVLTAAAGVGDVLDAGRVAPGLQGSDGRHYLIDAHDLELRYAAAIPIGHAVELPPMCEHEDQQRPPAKLESEAPLLSVFRIHDDGRTDVTASFLVVETEAKGFPTALWRDPAQRGEVARLCAGRVLRLAEPPRAGESQPLPTEGLGFTLYRILCGSPAPEPILEGPLWGGSTDDAAPMEGSLSDATARDARRALLDALGVDRRDHRLLDGALKGRGRRRNPSIRRGMA